LRLLVRNIGQLLTMSGPAWGEGIEPLGLVSRAALVAVEGRVVWRGAELDLPAEYSGFPAMDAQGAVVMPGLVECHTHLLFAGDRSHEFELRCLGASYERIAEAGGGILNTMKATRSASKAELVGLGVERLGRFLGYGVTTVEAKTGYGLERETEFRMLEAARELNSHSEFEVVSTFLAAHTVPPEFKANRGEYVRLVCQEWIPEVARLGLAEFVDVFSEAGAFTLAETEQVFQSARAAGLRLKIHSEQLTHSGATRLGASYGCVSADHLEFIDEEDAQALAASSTIAVLLPGATAFLGKKNYAPAHLLRKHGVTVAVSTDFNPGSSHTMNMWLMGTLGCAYYGMTPAQMLNAMTRGAALALCREDLGTLDSGSQADFVLLRHGDWNRALYEFGENPVASVFKRGRPVVVENSQQPLTL